MGKEAIIPAYPAEYGVWVINGIVIVNQKRGECDERKEVGSAYLGKG